MMKKEVIQQYLGKIVLIGLKNNYKYTCEIIKISEDSIDIIDKFNLKMTISLDSISSIMEVKHDH